MSSVSWLHWLRFWESRCTTNRSGGIHHLAFLRWSHNLGAYDAPKTGPLSALVQKTSLQRGTRSSTNTAQHGKLNGCWDGVSTAEQSLAQSARSDWSEQSPAHRCRLALSGGFYFIFHSFEFVHAFAPHRYKTYSPHTEIHASVRRHIRMRAWPRVPCSMESFQTGVNEKWDCN